MAHLCKYCDSNCYCSDDTDDGTVSNPTPKSCIGCGLCEGYEPQPKHSNIIPANNYPIYNFHYPHNGFDQKKILIPREVYDEYKAIPDDDTAKKFLKQHTKGMEWFIPSSAYYAAIESGIINANGKWPVVVTKIEP